MKAFVVPRPDVVPDAALARALQDHVEADIAPYKYPCALEFRTELPKTLSGKNQSFGLRITAKASAGPEGRAHDTTRRACLTRRLRRA